MDQKLRQLAESEDVFQRLRDLWSDCDVTRVENEQANPSISLLMTALRFKEDMHNVLRRLVP